ncbi:SET domain-containing protein [Flavisolibacter sp. BT320]|nr:SET domain-containing protein [Flavisolibacter longurius]
MALLEKHLFVDDSTIPGAGKGLFTKIEIEKGTRIVEYKGRRTIWKEVKNDSDNYYIYTINRNNVIDAQKTLSALARYANDARGFVKVKGLNNNCVYVNDGNRAFIESVKDIPAGAEIFVDYTQDYWKVLKENLRAEKQREKEEARKQAVAKKLDSKKATGKKTAAKKVTKTTVKKKSGAKKKATSK